MRITYLYQYFSTPSGSWGTRAYEMSRRWVKSGHKVTIVTSVYDKSDLRVTGLVGKYDFDGISVVAINVRLSNKDGFVKRIMSFLLFSLLSSWYAVRLKSDIVLASSGPLTIVLPALMARYIAGKKMVLEIRDLLPEVPIQLGLLSSRFMIVAARWLERMAYGASEMVIAASPGQAEGVRSVNSTVKTEVVTNASDLALFDAASDDDAVKKACANKPYVLYAGTFGYANDCEQILRAAKILSAQGSKIKVILIGDGKEKSRLMGYARDNNLTNVIIKETIPKNELVAWVKNAHAMLITLKNIPVFDTSSPNKLFDSLAAGVPVIQTTQGWIKGLLEEEECGITVSPENASELAAAVDKIVNDKAMNELMSSNAHKLAVSRFSRDKLSLKMEGLLRSVC